jgi:pyridoxal phosphate enzyme (YggS family)
VSNVAHLEENAHQLRKRVERAAEKAGRDPADVTIVAVSKTFDRALVDEAYRLGFRVYGESRVQEIRQKFENPLPIDAELHMIGQLQTNKVRQLVPHVQVVQTLDRMSLVNPLAKALARTEASISVMLQVNVSGEGQKAGIAPADLGDLVDAVLRSPEIRPVGLMTMAPFGAEDATLRQVFGGLRLLRDEMQQARGIALPALSMGMSDDFEVAIAEGATHIRIGRSLFGAR